jgi:spoIIIJ-associated protein
MRSIEIQATNVDEAVALALAQLGKTIDEVNVEILNPGRQGVPNVEDEEALVRVKVRNPEPEQDEMAAREVLSADELPSVATQVLETILQAMSLNAQVNTRPPDECDLEGGEEAETVCLDVTGDGLGILIGKRGETLSALQYLLNMIVSKKARTRTRIIVDVEGYRRRRREFLIGMAKRVADRVRQGGEPIPMEALPAFERRIIHIALRDDPDVMTQSTGEGEDRRVIIIPRSQ